MANSPHSANLLALVLTILWGGGLGVWHLRGGVSPLDRIEAPLTDLRFMVQGQRPAPDSVVILAIDDETVQEVGSYPLPRSIVAQLVAGVGRLGAKVVALDLLFVARSAPEQDQALSAALAGTRSVLASAGVFDRPKQTIMPAGRGELDHVPVARSVLLPIDSLARVAAIGLVNVTTDSSGVPRHIPLLLRTGDQLLPSFALRAASVALSQDPIIALDHMDFGGRIFRTDTGFSLPLRFYGPRDSIRTISANEVLKGTIEPEAVRGKIVLIGATVTGGGDVFPTPFDPVLPGVEVMATAIAHLTTGDGLLRDKRVRFVDATFSVILPLLFVLLLAWRRSAVGFSLILAIALFWVGLTIVAFAHGVWLSATLPLAAAAPPAILFGAARLWLDRRRADTLDQESNTLRHFQAPILADRLKQDPNFLSTPIRQEAAFVFIDLSGFTGLSETLDPAQTREIIREFHALVDEEALRCHGLVDNFMGDGAMIVFGLPEPTPEDPCHAVEACVALCFRIEGWLASLPRPISSRLGFKIGAHHGVIVASRLGGASHQHITAIGDTVNVASRLMEIAASHRADVALSDNLVRAAGQACSVLDSGLLEETIRMSIRGRAGTLDVRLWRSRKPNSEHLS